MLYRFQNKTFDENMDADSSSTKSWYERLKIFPYEYSHFIRITVKLKNYDKTLNMVSSILAIKVSFLRDIIN